MADFAEVGEKIVNTVSKTISNVVEKVKTVAKNVKEDMKNFDLNNTSEKKC